MIKNCPAEQGLKGRELQRGRGFLVSSVRREGLFIVGPGDLVALFLDLGWF
jgi:hypothetical protein